MELFELTAKLTLDSTEYESAIEEAENHGESLQDVKANLDLDISDFEDKVEEAEDTEVEDPEDPELGLDDSQFQAKVEEVDKTQVEGPEDPELGLDDGAFESAIANDNEAEVDDPEEPELGLEDSDFNAGIESANDATVSDIPDPSLGLDDSDFTDKVDSANQATVSDINASLGLDTSEYESGLSSAEQSSGIFGEVVGQVFTNLKGVIVGAGITAAIGKIVSGLEEAVNLVSTIGDDVDKGSRRLTISTDAYQEWNHALSMSGASISDFNRGIRNMRTALEDVQGLFQLDKEGNMSELGAAFRDLGLQSKMANGEIISTEQLLGATIKALADFPGTKEQRGILAEAIFGRNAQQLNALFDSGSEGIQQLIDESHELGLVMTEEEVANAAALNDAQSNLNDSLNALKTSLISDIVPALTEAINMASKLIAFFNWRTGDVPLSQTFDDIDKGSVDAFASIDKTQGVAMELADKLIAMGDASKLTAEKQAEWKGIAEELIGLIPGLSEVIDTDTKSISGNAEQIQEVINKWGELSRQRALAEADEQKRAALVNRSTEAIDAQVTAQVKASEADVVRAKNMERLNEILTAHGKASTTEVFDTQAKVQDFGSVTAGLGKDRQEAQALVTEMYNAETAAQRAKEKAEELSKEVEKGREEYRLWKEAAEGLFDTTVDSAGEAETAITDVGNAVNDLPDSKTITIDVKTNFDKSKLTGILGGSSFGVQNRQVFTHAKGAWNVPYDDYPALLHRDETVLTASEARRYKEGESQGVDTRALASAISSAIQGSMSGMSVMIDGQIAGTLVAEPVSRSIAGQIRRGRYS